MRHKSKVGVMAAFLVTVMTLVCGLGLTGCDKGDSIQASDAGPSMYDILGRHDAYVNADITLSPTQKQIYMRSSALVRKLLDTALAPAKAKAAAKTKTATALSTNTNVKASTMLEDFEKMEALQRLAYTYVSKECKKDGKNLSYKEFSTSGPHAVTVDMMIEDFSVPAVGNDECEKCIVLKDGKFTPYDKAEIVPLPEIAKTDKPLPAPH